MLVSLELLYQMAAIYAREPPSLAKTRLDRVKNRAETYSETYSEYISAQHEVCPPTPRFVAPFVLYAGLRLSGKIGPPGGIRTMYDYGEYEEDNARLLSVA